MSMASTCSVLIVVVCSKSYKEQTRWRCSSGCDWDCCNECIKGVLPDTTTTSSMTAADGGDGGVTISTSARHSNHTHALQSRLGSYYCDGNPSSQTSSYHFVLLICMATCDAYACIVCSKLFENTIRWRCIAGCDWDCCPSCLSPTVAAATSPSP
jgi:hypothetical protein